MSVKRVGLQLDEELIAKIDTYAGKLHVNRTAAISMMLSQYIMGLELQKSLSILTDEKEDLSASSKE